MAERLDQLFVLLKHWLVSHFPDAWQPLASILLSITPIVKFKSKYSLKVNVGIQADLNFNIKF